MYLILQFYSNRENLMLAKYTCFTVYSYYRYNQQKNVPKTSSGKNMGIGGFTWSNYNKAAVAVVAVAVV